MNDRERDEAPAPSEDDTEGQGFRNAAPGDEEDTEGHNLSMNPIMADQLARSRDADVQRDARRGFFRRDAKKDQRRGR